MQARIRSTASTGTARRLDRTLSSKVVTGETGWRRKGNPNSRSLSRKPVVEFASVVDAVRWESPCYAYAGGGRKPPISAASSRARPDDLQAHR
jgi:hypothetical protein